MNLKLAFLLLSSSLLTACVKHQDTICYDPNIWPRLPDTCVVGEDNPSTISTPKQNDDNGGPSDDNGGSTDDDGGEDNGGDTSDDNGGDTTDDTPDDHGGNPCGGNCGNGQGNGGGNGTGNEGNGQGPKK